MIDLKLPIDEIQEGSSIPSLNIATSDQEDIPTSLNVTIPTSDTGSEETKLHIELKTGAILTDNIVMDVNIPEVAKPEGDIYNTNNYVYNIHELLWKGAYNPGLAYVKGSQVRFLDGEVLSLYVAIIDVPIGILPSDTRYWDLQLSGISLDQIETLVKLEVLVEDLSTKIDESISLEDIRSYIDLLALLETKVRELDLSSKSYLTGSYAEYINRQLTNINDKITVIERSLSDKVSIKQLAKVEGDLSEVISSVASIKLKLSRTVSSSDLQAIEDKVRVLETDSIITKHNLQTKAEYVYVDEIKNQLRTQIGNVAEDFMAEKTALSIVLSKLTNSLHLLKLSNADKIGIDEFDVVIDAIANLTLRVDSFQVESSSAKQINELTNEIERLKTSIRTSAEEIELKASSEILGHFNEVLRKTEAKLVIQADRIAATVSQKDFNSFGVMILEKIAGMAITPEQIELFAKRVDLDALGQRVGEAEASLVVQANQIALKASTQYVNNTASSIAWGYYDLGIKYTDNQVSSFKSEVDASLVVLADEIASKVTQSDFDQVGNRLASAEASIVVHAGQIASKVEQSVFDSLGNVVNNQGTLIQQNTASIISKASQSSVDALGGRLGTAESVIVQQANLISQKVSQSEVNTAIGNIKIGARNFMRNSGDFKTTEYWNEHGSNRVVSNEVLYNGQNTLKIWGNSGGVVNSIVMRVKQNHDITVTANIYSTIDFLGGIAEAGDRIVHIQCWTIESGANIHQESTYEYKEVLEANKWNIVYKKFKTPVSSEDVFIRIYLYDLPVDPIYLGDIKLEEGNKATTWTPAPEDIDVRITNNETAITQKADIIALTAVSNTVDSLGNRVGSAEAQLTVQAGQIATKVSQTDVNNSINAIQIGSRNLVLKSDELKYSNGYLVSGYVLSEDIIFGQEYVVTIWGSADNNGYFGLWDGAGQAGGWQIFKISEGVYRGNFITREWYGDKNHISIYQQPYTLQNASQILKIQLEIGNKGSDWKPAPEDIEGEVTALTTRVSTAETTIIQNSQQIELKASKTEVTQEINNIKIGGKNLFQYGDFRNKTNMLTADRHGISNAVFGKNPYGIGGYFDNNILFCNGSNADMYITLAPYIKMKANTQYTISYMLKSNTDGAVIGSSSYLYTPSGVIGISQDGFIANNTWQKITYTFTNPVDSTTNRFRVGIATNGAYSWFATTLIQIEEGNKATDFTRNEIDVEFGNIYAKGTSIDQAPVTNAVQRVNGIISFDYAAIGFQFRSYNPEDLELYEARDIHFSDHTTLTAVLSYYNNPVNNLKGKIIVITSWDYIHIDTNMRMQLMQMGGIDDPTLQIIGRIPWTFIGQVGIGAGKGFETYSHAGDANAPSAILNASVRNGVLVGKDNTITQPIKRLETSLIVANDNITATSTRVDGLSGRMSSAEAKITPEAINLTVSEQVRVSTGKTSQPIDLRGYDPNTSYPVIIRLSGDGSRYRISVQRSLRTDYGVPPYATHSSGFSMSMIWTSNGAGWGTQPRVVNVEKVFIGFVNDSRGWGSIQQNEMASEEIFYLRGGSLYDVFVEGTTNPNNIILYASGYYWENGPYNYSAPVISHIHAHLPEVSYQTKANIQAGITIESNAINIYGQSLTLTGAVTFQSLDGGTRDYITVIDGGRITTNSLHGDKITAGTLHGNRMIANSIHGSAITAGTITTNEIAAYSVHANRLIAGSITADLIAGETITGDKLAVNSIHANRIQAGTITADKINLIDLFAQNISASNLIVTGSSKIAGFSVDGNNLRNPSGDASIQIGNSSDYVNVNSSSSLLSVGTSNSSRRGINIQTYAANCVGLYIINNMDGAGAIKSYGSHEFYQRQGETWNAPGVLASFHTPVANPSIINLWKIYSLNINSITASGSGSSRRITINHNIPHNEYTINASLYEDPVYYIGSSTNSYSQAHITNIYITNNKIEIDVTGAQTSSGSFPNYNFGKIQITIIGRNVYIP